ncbi:unnamed protein product [Mytilus coruscus]|uniref:Uncharacterized protein n=1 Tax=Mytilus coruscus TaxID=42192 RepID=A0A6J8E377_MYTCO|nr:unnamed protein product [Mytilus coruscus]
MDHLQELFLENQRDLDREFENAPKPPECEHEWERVLIYGVIPGYSCSRCGAEWYNRIDDQDFKGRTYNFRSYRKPRQSPGPPCCIKTVRGHQCTYPSISGSDKCKRHLKLFPEDCWRCGVKIARGKVLHRIHEETLCVPKFATLWSGVKVRMVGEYDVLKDMQRAGEPFCSSKCMGPNA